MTYTTINGWTKEKMKAQIRAKNNGKRAFDARKTACVYRTKDGNACAVGCFLSEKQAKKIGRYAGTVTLLFRDFKEELKLEETMPIVLPALRQLQYIHDDYEGDGDVRDVLFAWIDENVVDEVAG